MGYISLGSDRRVVCKFLPNADNLLTSPRGIQKEPMLVHKYQTSVLDTSDANDENYLVWYPILISCTVHSQS